MPDRELPTPTVETTLLIWLLDVLQPMNRTRVKQLLRSGRVTVNREPTSRHDHPLRPGDRIAVSPESAAPSRAPARTQDVEVVHIDNALVVIDKPAGLLSVATDAQKLDTAFTRLSAYLARHQAGRPYVVHRLDRDTSGLLLFARRPEIRDRIQSEWESVTKTYLAVVEGRPLAESGIVENSLLEGKDLRVRPAKPDRPGAKRARSRYRVVACHGPYSLVEIVLETGRKHQIRVHLAGLGCPIAGDEAYGAKTNPAGRLALHAWRLALPHPLTGQPLALESPYPAKLRRLVSG